MLKKLENILPLIGNTPCFKIDHEQIDLYVKLEYYNFMGSIKDRAAYYIIKSAIESGEINQNTTIIEASSGNMAVALSSICKLIGLKFIPVIDPNINCIYEEILKKLSYKIVKVGTLDSNNGYLLTKLDFVKNYCQNNKNVFWTNQYENINNYKAHYFGTGMELARDFKNIDYAFIAVASGGTISGVSKRLKEAFPKIKIIAVDTVGSVIFDKLPSARFIPGMGSGIKPKLVEKAEIDDIIHIHESDTIAACDKLLTNFSLFLGGSSGTVYHAICEYFKNKVFEERPNVVFISPDRGSAYIDNIYNKEWIESFHKKTSKIKKEEKCYI